MKTEEFSEKGVGGGSIREHLNNEGLQKKKRGLKAHQKGRIIKGAY